MPVTGESAVRNCQSQNECRYDAEIYDLLKPEPAHLFSPSQLLDAPQAGAKSDIEGRGLRARQLTISLPGDQPEHLCLPANADFRNTCHDECSSLLRSIHDERGELSKVRNCEKESNRAAVI
jgi:hypothetical protein